VNKCLHTVASSWTFLLTLDKCHFTKGINMNVSSAKSHVENVYIVYRPHTVEVSRALCFLHRCEVHLIPRTTRPCLQCL